MNVGSRPEDDLICRQGAKHPLTERGGPPYAMANGGGPDLGQHKKA